MDFEENMVKIFDSLKGDEYTRKELIDILESNQIKVPNPWEPSDYCYNKTNKGIKNYKQKIHLFESIGHGKYRIIGQNSEYSGCVKDKSGKIVGEWNSGKYYDR